MMRLPESFLSPWPQGMDTAHEDTHAVFQPSDKQAARLLNAVNVDLTDEGLPQLRSGLTSRKALSSGKNIFYGAGLLLVQDGGSILLIDPDDWSSSTLISGLTASARVEFAVHAGQIFWLNGEVSGRILADGTTAPWGVSQAPTPTLGQTNGDLPAGRYLVAATFVDSQGVEHSCDQAAVTTLTSAKAITVDLASVSSDAVSVRIYATKPDDTGLFWVASVSPAALPFTINAVDVSETPLRTQHLTPPPLGDGLFSYKGWLAVFRDKYLFTSLGNNPFVFDPRWRVQARPTAIRAGAGLDDGFWTVCERGAFWTTGDVPQSWQTHQRDNRRYAAGSLVLPGYLVAGIQTPLEIAVFVSEDGLVAGLPGGALQPLHLDQLRLDVEDKRASMIYWSRSKMRQILFSLEDI